MPSSSSGPVNTGLKVLLVSDDNPLALVLTQKFLDLGCLVDLFVDDRKPWLKKDLKHFDDKLFSLIETERLTSEKEANYLLFLDLVDKAIAPKEKSFQNRRRKIDLVLDSARKNKAKVLFVFPYLQTRKHYRDTNSLIKRIKEAKDIRSSLSFVGEAVNSRQGILSKGFFGEVLKAFVSGKLVKNAPEDLKLFPTPVDGAVTVLIKRLFSFSFEKKPFAVVSEGLSFSEIDSFLKTKKKDLKSFTSLEIGNLERARVAEKVVLSFDLKELVESLLGPTRLLQKNKSKETRRLLTKRVDEFKKDSAFTKIMQLNQFKSAGSSTHALSQQISPKKKVSFLIHPFRENTLSAKTKYPRTGSFVARLKRKRKADAHGFLRRWLKQKRTKSPLLLVRQSLHQERSKERKKDNPFLNGLPAKKHLCQFLLLIIIFLLIPPVSLIAGVAFNLSAGKMIKEGNFDLAKKVLTLSAKSARLAERSYLFLSGVWRLSDDFFQAARLSKVVNKLSLTTNNYLLVYEDTFDLYLNTVGKKEVDVRPLAKEISLDLDYLYRETGFIKNEFSTLTPLAGEIGIELLDNLVDLPLAGANVPSNPPLDELISWLGIDGPKTYLVLLLDNLNPRPGGGVVVSFALVSFDRGKIIETRIFSVDYLEQELMGQVAPPEIITNYLGKSNWEFREVAWHPNFSLTADKATWFVNQALGEKVDGVVSLNYRSLTDLLQIVDPVLTRKFQAKVSDQKVFQPAGEIDFGKKYLGDLPAEVLEFVIGRLTKLTLFEWPKLMKSFSADLLTKDIQVFVGGRTYGFSSSLPGCGDTCLADTIQITETNLSDSSPPFQIERRAELKVSFEEGVIKRNLLYYLTNQSTRKTDDKSLAGISNARYNALVSLRVPESSGFGMIKILGNEGSGGVFPKTAPDLDQKLVGVSVEIDPGETKKILISWESAIEEPGEKKEYQLSWLKQSGVPGFPLEITYYHPNKLLSDDLNLSLTTDGGFRYNTSLTRDLVSSIYWQ